MKTRSTKKVVNKLNLIKIKNLRSMKDNVKTMKKTSHKQGTTFGAHISDKGDYSKDYSK